MKCLMAALVRLLVLFMPVMATAVPISGTVTNNQGVQMCALVLANGQFMFSCSPNGSYSLDVPLDASGQITIFAFADGHFPFKKVVSSGGRYDLQMTVASSGPPATSSRYDKTALLVGGTWTFTYTIISVFSDSYTFTRVDPTPTSDGDYVALGTSSYGRTVGGGWMQGLGSYMVLAPGTIIDQVYTFTLSGNNFASGCYYQVNPPGSTNLSRCYAMTGQRSPPKAMSLSSDPERLLREVSMDPLHEAPDPAVLNGYLDLKRRMAQ